MVTVKITKIIGGNATNQKCSEKDPKCQRPPSFLGGHGEDGALSVKLENRQLKFEI